MVIVCVCVCVCVFLPSPGVYSTAEIPSGSVLGLTVDDPRLTLPRIRGKAMPSIQQAQGNFETPPPPPSVSMVPVLPYQFCHSSVVLWYGPHAGGTEAGSVCHVWSCAPGEPLPTHADVPGSNPGRILCPRPGPRSPTHSHPHRPIRHGTTTLHPKPVNPMGCLPDTDLTRCHIGISSMEVSLGFNNLIWLTWSAIC